jgi:hypothetical protein
VFAFFCHFYVNDSCIATPEHTSFLLITFSLTALAQPFNPDASGHVGDTVFLRSSKRACRLVGDFVQESYLERAYAGNESRRRIYLDAKGNEYLDKDELQEALRKPAVSEGDEINYMFSDEGHRSRSQKHAPTVRTGLLRKYPDGAITDKPDSLMNPAINLSEWGVVIPVCGLPPVLRAKVSGLPPDGEYVFCSLHFPVGMLHASPKMPVCGLFPYSYIFTVSVPFVSMDARCMRSL